MSETKTFSAASNFNAEAKALEYLKKSAASEGYSDFGAFSVMKGADLGVNKENVYSLVAGKSV